MNREGWLGVVVIIACLCWLAMGCGTITTGELDAGIGGAGVGGAGVGGAGVGGAGVGGASGCVAGCVPACGAACSACPAVDGGSAVMACGPQGFELCCRFAGDGRAYCSGRELCP